MEHGNQQSLIKQTQGSPELHTQASLPSQFQGVEPSPQHKVLFEPCRESSKCCSHLNVTQQVSLLQQIRP